MNHRELAGFFLDPERVLRKLKQKSPAILVDKGIVIRAINALYQGINIDLRSSDSGERQHVFQYNHILDTCKKRLFIVIELSKDAGMSEGVWLEAVENVF